MQLTAVSILLANSQIIALGIVAGALLLILLILALILPKIPSFLLRLSCRARYRASILGTENIPKTGSALLVCGEGEYLDFLPLILATKRRIRFFLFDGWTTSPSEARLLRKLGAITLGGNATSRELVHATQSIITALQEGELVCIFVQERQADSGANLDFTRLYQKLQERCNVLALPVSIDYPEGSPWKHQDGQFISKHSRLWRYPVWISIGEPVDLTKPGAEMVQKIQHLSASTAIEQSREHLPVHRCFVRYAAKHPNRRCIVDGMTNTTLTYGRTLAGGMCLAKQLKPKLAEQQFIGIWLPPGIGSALTNLALTLLGKTSVNLNYTASVGSINSSISQCGIKTVITAKRFVSRVPLETDSEIQIIHLEDILKAITKTAKLLAFLKVLLLPGFVLDRWILKLGRHKLDDLITVIFSSGTTGEPKGVMLTHRNVKANAISITATTGVYKNDTVLGVLPLFHSFGYTVTFWVPLQIGASVVYYPDPRQPREIGALSKKYHCTAFIMTATFLRFCLKRCEPNDFSNIWFLVCGAEKLPVSLAEDFQKKFGVMPVEGYGCTELTPVTAANLPNQTTNGVTAIRNRPGTIGPPLRGVASTVIDPENSSAKPIGEEGLLVIRGPNVMQGYLGKEEMTQKVMLDGQYITGDMARIDTEGKITLTGRLSRFAKIAGEMVPLEELEEKLHAVAKTTERILAVASVPDEKRGERIIVLYLQSEQVDVQTLCRGLSEERVPNLWIPAEKDFLPIESLPILGTGKLDLKRLKDLAMEMLSVLR